MKIISLRILEALDKATSLDQEHYTFQNSIKRGIHTQRKGGYFDILL